MAFRKALLLFIAAFIAVALFGFSLLITRQIQADAHVNDRAEDRASPELAADVMNYQGHLTDDQGQPINGQVKLDFTIYDGDAAEVWTETHNDVSVTDGFFNVLLGTNSPLNASHFIGSRHFLEVAVDDGTPLPVQRLASVPYSFRADVAPWDGLTGVPVGFADGIDDIGDDPSYENVIIVAKSGGDFSSIQDAINDVSMATADNPTLVWIAPGTYTETVTMKPDVHLQGSGQGVTIITSDASSQGFPPDATLVLAQSSSVRNLRVHNSGTGENHKTAAILGTSGISQTQLVDVTAEGNGAGTYTYGIYLRDLGTTVTLVNVTASAYGATGATPTNEALSVNFEALVNVTGGTFTSKGGYFSRGISIWTGSRASINDASALAESADNNYGLYIYNSVAELRGGSYTAIGGEDTAAIYTYNTADSASKVTASLTNAIAEGGSNTNIAFNNSSGGEVQLIGSHFLASGGTHSYGIWNADVAEETVILDVTSVAENGSEYNYGLYNSGIVTATIRNSNFDARGHGDVQGIRHHGGKLKGTNISASAAGGTTNYGMIVSGATSDVAMAQSVFSGSDISVSGGGGTVTIANSRLVGGPIAGTVSCTLVSRGTNVNSGTSCP